MPKSKTRRTRKTPHQHAFKQTRYFPSPLWACTSCEEIRDSDPALDRPAFTMFDRILNPGAHR